ncbi:MAG: PEP/pyruvate-binding domain-containing protein [Desulfobacterales bacterium]|nr:PEP/pyruvate-binding domain-containing protein [Desulfobacterales bacterium]
MQIQSKALEVNIADYHIDVDIDPKYEVMQLVMSRYYGLMEGLNTFLKELSHPYKNWQFIVKESRGYALDYFHLLTAHPRGPEVAELFFEIFLAAIKSGNNAKVQTDAVDNLLLYVQKIIKDAKGDIGRFLPALNTCFRKIAALNVPLFNLFIKSYYQIKRLAALYRQKAADSKVEFDAIGLLLAKYYKNTYAYWLSEVDPHGWFIKAIGKNESAVHLSELFKEISHRRIEAARDDLENYIQSARRKDGTLIDQLITLPGFQEIVEVYREVPQKLLELGRDERTGYRWKIIFLFHMMSISGLSLVHEEALREINRTLSWLIGHESHRQIKRLIDKTFAILKTGTQEFPATVLNCALTMGKGVYQTDESDLINLYIDSMIDLGFQAPKIRGVGNDWQIKANIAHILNIRTWLELIQLNPKWSPKLLSYLTIHLSVCGVFIKDTDLFPRDITRLLNSPIEPVYNLVKQLARLFPVFFNDIGAEGKLRDISTEIDEITRRKDVLVHFLRKQSHVESSNQILDFMRATLVFWTTCDKSILKPFLPPYIYAQVAADGEFVDGIHNTMSLLLKQGLQLPDALLELSDERLNQLLADVRDVSNIDIRRVQLAAKLYKLLYQKYRLDFTEMDHYLSQLRPGAFPNLDALETALAETDSKRKLSGLISFLEEIKTLILSSNRYEARENIYKKRHFTVDIPSMYGSYNELKFDGLGLTFRLESLVNALFDICISKIDLTLITKATFFQIYDLLILFGRALKLDGISSVEFERQLDFLSLSLEMRGFTFTQYLDIIKGFAQAVKNIINDCFNNIHEENLNRIFTRIEKDQILPKYLPRDEMGEDEKLVHRISEIFLRDQIALSLGLQQLDYFLNRILHTLFHQADKLHKAKLQQLLNYDPKRAITTIYDTNKRLFRVIYLGAKGYHLAQLTQFGLPVPPGFIITTEVFRSREIIETYPPAQQNFRDQLADHMKLLEKTAVKVFGDPKNPLLVSVRSGSPISQPGMMDTFLDVGLNEEIAHGIATYTGNTWFAWDNYRRFVQCYGMSFGLSRNHFDAIMADFKKRIGVAYKRGLPGDQMKNMALTYKQLVQDHGIAIQENPFEQLMVIIKKVLDSWESPKAKTYRQIIEISDDWGTTVSVQAMVFGNRSQTSGTGVFFTHNPRWSGDTLKLWGDFTLGNQGEDVVSGLVKTLPISEMQQEIEKRETDITLETHYPAIYNTLLRWANELIYRRGWSPQEIEFTFESSDPKDLYLLQTRDMAMRERKKVLTFDLAECGNDKLLGHGIGVSGGAMSGRAVFSLEEIDHWRNLEPNTPLVLIRGDTVPDDIREIFAADGLLTARGGLTSHAAVVAHRMGKTCVVGCEDLICDENERYFIFRQAKVNSGDHISIDGRGGSVYLGKIKVNEA